MKKNSALLFILFASLHVKADSWTQKANVGNVARNAASGFSIGAKGYIGFGFNFSLSPALRRDFWEYDQAANTWTQKANFTGSARSGAAGFSIGAKGFIACGFDNAIKKELWEYDPSSNSWTQKTNFGGLGRDYTVAFEINSLGYVGTGFDANFTNYNDFWQYNPVTNAWTQKANVGGGPRSSAFGFSINGKGYIGNGYDGGPKNDFWEYNPSTNIWTQKANVPGGLRSDGIGFAIGNFGYAGTGYVGSTAQQDFWQYSPVTNTWVQKASLTGVARTNPVGFSIGTKGYIGTGWDNSLNFLNDFWEYSPDQSPLPVELLYFKGKNYGEKNNLTWATASENNSSYFEVEKSHDMVTFCSIGKINSAGNSSSVLYYKFTDDKLLEEINYYRLKETDFNGTTSSSKIIILKTSSEHETLLSVYPNPAKQSFTFRLPNDEVFTMCITDANGKKILEQNNSEDEAIINCSNFPKGIYFITAAGSKAVYTARLVKE